MTGFSINKLAVKNFKYISTNSPLEFDFEDNNALILDGPNGYGKTTLFDVIDMLINGEITHFNDGFLNRGKESIRTLANNNNDEIIIEAEFSSNQVNYLIKRVVLPSGMIKLYINNEECNNDKLYSLLGISHDFFNLGAYISQSKSLSFLENKYKDRRDILSSLFNIDDEILQANRVSNIYTSVKEEIGKADADFNAQIVRISSERNELLKSISDNNVDSSNKYEKLFPEDDLEFDKEQIDFGGTTLSDFLTVVKNIRFYIENYNNYKVYKDNEKILRIINTNKNAFLALYYSKTIKLLKENATTVEDLKQCAVELSKYESKKWEFNYDLLKRIGVPENVLIILKELTTSLLLANTTLDGSKKLLLSLENARDVLCMQHEKVAQIYKNTNNKCPLCGTEFDNLNSVVSDYGKELDKLSDSSLKNAKTISLEREKVIIEQIVPVIRGFIVKNNLYAELDNRFSMLTNVPIEELEQNLKNLSLSFTAADDEIVDFSKFESEYKDLLTKLRKLMKTPEKNLSSDEIELCRTISNQYYSNAKPTHSLAQIDSKINFISAAYFNGCKKHIEELNEKYQSIENKYRAFSEKSNRLLDTLKKLKDKYDDAIKKYKKELSSAIKTPLLIYSGRIIQNYPLGLGINTHVDKNKIQFSPIGKPDVDVLNILSTGQLNGLAIAILLSVRNIYCNTNGLNILLIDDPLQTIDDISAISLADLLSQQNAKQIILSTHESTKSELFRYKFKKSDYKVLSINMKDTYLHHSKS
ncbi:MAG: hypothetical protein IJK26_07955 [Clostridia bacterium]|nr:hypothetical protein [Clostridia bacterium]